MAKKRQSRNKSHTRYSATTRIAEPVNPFERKQHRYTPKYLTLAIMGGAAFFLLKGCGDDGNTDNDGDGTFYSTMNDCIDDGNSASVCADGWNNAKTEFYANVPKQLTQENCQSQFGDCYFDSTERSWLPVFSGFFAQSDNPSES
ncbi:membrane protein [Salmonella bongori]|nr:membrane protein [Salmonella bongori]